MKRVLTAGLGWFAAAGVLALIAAGMDDLASMLRIGPGDRGPGFQVLPLVLLVEAIALAVQGVQVFFWHRIRDSRRRRSDPDVLAGRRPLFAGPLAIFMVLPLALAIGIGLVGKGTPNLHHRSHRRAAAGARGLPASLELGVGGRSVPGNRRDVVGVGGPAL